MTGSEVALREYVEALLNEQQRAIEMAEREREKTAIALAAGLARLTEEGDERLREHIENQVRQLAAALEAADKRHGMLRDEVILRDAALRDLLIQTSESNDLRVREAFAAAAAAIGKQEAANEVRFQSVNEFREQLGEQAREFVPREVADSQIGDLRSRIETNANAILSSRQYTVSKDQYDVMVGELATWRTRVDRTLAERQGGAQQRQLTGAQISLLIAAVGVIVSVIVVANALSGP